MRRCINRLCSIILSFAIIIIYVSPMPISVSSAEADNIVARAYYMYDSTWVCQKQVSGWNDTFQKGQTYRIPYGQPATAGMYIGFGVTLDTFLNATQDATSIFYTKQSFWEGTGTKSTFYASDCSAFVSYCWGINRTTTANWSSLNVTNLGSASSMANLNNLQPGDALNHAKDHIVLVTAVNSDGTIEIMQQTPPQLRKDTFSKSDIAKKYSQYTIYRYNNRDNVAPPPNTTPNPNLPCKIDLTDFQNPKEGYIHNPGSSCGLYGTITSNHTLKHIWGGVYNPDGTPASGSSTTCDDYPNSTSYSLRGKFNNSIIFDDIPEGSYYFSISAEDNDGFKKELIHNNFTVGNPRPSTYSVSLNANGGSVLPTSITVSANGTYSELPTPSRYGYDFAGWFDDSGRQVSDGTGIYTNTEHTLYAHWNPKPVTVYLNANGGMISPNTIQISFDNNYNNLPNPVRDGYNFVGWFTTADGGTQVNFNSVCNTVNEHSLFAHWDKNKIMITFNAMGGTVETANKLVVYDNKYGVLPTPEKKGYEFKGWYLDESYNKPITKDTIVDVTGNKTVYAKWNIRQFVVTFDAGEGTPDVETKRVVFGKTYGVLPEAALGKDVFLGWFTVDGIEITSESIVELEEDAVLYARWKVQGDVNVDGVFDVQDIIMVQDWLLAKPKATLDDWRAADVCQDERIDVFDLCLLKRMLLERNGKEG